LGGGIFSLGFLVGKQAIKLEKGYLPKIIRHEERAPSDIDFNLFWDVWEMVDKEYIGEVDHWKMFYGAIAGMVQAVGDPYTVYLDPEKAKLFSENLSGEFGGIGIEIGVKNNQLTVMSVLKNTPAEKAGLLAGDIILKINDELASDLTIDEAVLKIRGDKGTSVRLTIQRPGKNEEKEYTIVRDIIKIEVLSSEMKGKIGYLKLNQFTENIKEEFHRELRDLLAKNPKALILDLRDNSGGSLSGAVDVASEFIKKGVIVIEEYKNGKKLTLEAKGNGQAYDLPLVVLINKGSASASEILAAAIRDYKRGTLIGEKTFGKGSVQKVEELKFGMLKITLAKWLTPLGEWINGQGIEPEIKIELTEEDLKANKDPQLEKALRYLGEKIK